MGQQPVAGGGATRARCLEGAIEDPRCVPVTVTVLCMVIGAFVGCTSRPVLDRSDVPDVIVITVDTLRPDRIGAYGHAGARTPHLDALAARGVRFDDAFTPLPRTTPALASMLTGLAPHRHGSREVGEAMTAGRSIARDFAAAGYRTIGISGTPVAGPDQGLDGGFDAFEVHFEMTAPDMAARALAMVGDTPRPVFLWVHAVDPHFPYLAPGAPYGPCAVLGRKAAADQLARVDLFIDHEGVSTAALADCWVQYDHEVATADAGIGVLLDGLAARGGTPWVVMSADHGEHFGEAGIFYEHGPSVHEAALRIPLLIAGPGVVPHVDGGVASLEDVAPTLLAAAGLAVPPGLDGQDLGPRLEGRAPEDDRVVVAESGSALNARFLRALLAGRPERRQCVHVAPWSLCSRPNKAPTLHQHLIDPKLLTDVASAHPDVVVDLQAVAEHWPGTARERVARSTTHALTLKPLPSGTYAATLAPEDPSLDLSSLRAGLSRLPGETTVGVDAQTEAALRALGYIGD